MKKICLTLILAILLFSASVFANSAGSTQYAGFKEWKSPNSGEAPQGEGIKVADVDSDGNLEIIIISDDGFIRIFEHDGTTYQEEWKSQILATSLDDIAIGDTDNDGRPEIIVSTMEAGNTRFYVFGFDGSNYEQEWQSSIFSGDGYIGLSLYTEDTDSDGAPEIIVTSDEGDKAYAWIFDYNDPNYQEEWSSGLLDTYDVIEFYGLSETDGDGFKEMIFAGEVIYIVGWNGTNYQLEWQSGWMDGWVECIVGDVDNMESTPEIVAAVERGNIRIYGFNGSNYVLEWESADIDAAGGQIGDVDNDGIQEIAVGSFTGDIYVFGHDGNDYQLEWQTATPSPYVYIERIEDFDGHGGEEILAQELTDEDSSDETGYCDVFTHDGEEYRLSWRDEKLDSYFGGLLNPAGDVDNDSVPEEIRFANNESRYYPYSIYVIGPAKQMPTCSSPLKGDLNGDCKVDFRDLAEMAENWLKCNLIAQEDCWKQGEKTSRNKQGQAQMAVC